MERPSNLRGIRSQAAQDAILRLGWQPINCGYWAAGGNPPLATCLEKVDDADVVVVIVAHRHGWTPQEPPGDEKKSITRLECERAKELGREAIPFIVDERAPWDADRYEFYAAQIAKPEEAGRVIAEVQRNLEALKEFKAWLNTIGTRVQFATPAQLETEVLHALTEWGRRQGVTQTTASGPSVRARYLEWLRRTCESVELLGLDLKETQNVRLGQVYVPAVTAPKVDKKGDERKAEFGRERQPDLLLDRRAPQTPRTGLPVAHAGVAGLR